MRKDKHAGKSRIQKVSDAGTQTGCFKNIHLNLRCNISIRVSAFGVLYAAAGVFVMVVWTFGTTDGIFVAVGWVFVTAVGIFVAGGGVFGTVAGVLDAVGGILDAAAGVLDAVAGILEAAGEM